MNIQRVLLASIFVAGSFYATSQETPGSDQKEMNKWSIGAQIGAHDGFAPSKNTTRLFQLHHFGLNGRYMFNNRVGIQLDMNYDLFDFYKAGINTNYVRTSIQGVVNAGDILRFHTFSKRLGLLVHAGTGLSNMWQSEQYRTLNPGKKLFKNSDDMLNYIFGATPQLKINERLSLNADVAFIFHHNQNFHYNMRSINTHGAIDGYFLNLSVGASYYFGKNAKHADWVTTEIDFSKYDQAIQELQEKTKDDDNDGVANAFDKEPNTTEGAKVDQHGVTLLPANQRDTDSDGVMDAEDLCPDLAGSKSAKGCIDTDSDNVPDILDNCPNEAGDPAYSGCTPKNVSVKEVSKYEVLPVLFAYNKTVIQPEYINCLDNALAILNKDTSVKLTLEGHSDEVGETNQNNTLSLNRAMACKEYLVSKGIPESRISVESVGELKPIYGGKSIESLAANRAVVFMFR